MSRLLLILILPINFLYAKIIIHNDKKIDDFHILYYYDKSKKLTIDQISKLDFKDQLKNQIALGYKKGNIWFKFEIENKSSNEEFILYLNEPFFEETNLYSLKNKKWEKNINGLFIPLENREIYHHNPAFNIQIPKDSTKVFYIQTFNRFGSFGEFQIHEKRSFNHFHKVLYILVYLLYFGGLIIIIILNLFLYIKLKDKIYIYYVGYTSFFTLFIFLFSGLSIYAGLQSLHYELHMSVSLFIIFLLLFSIHFLEIEKYNKTLKKVFRGFCIFFGILTFLLLYNVEPWYEVLSSIASIVFILLAGSAIYVWKKGHNNAKYYIFALSFYLVTIAFVSSVANGWIEYNNINRYSFLIGSYIEIIFFSLMLAERFNSIQNQKLNIQKELIEITEKKELILEKEIKERTKKIVVLLEEKDLLLKEVYHRIKNNFQILIGIIWMEENNIKDKTAKNIFPDFISRITSMSLVHRLLYESDNLSEIDSKRYINKIISQIQRSYSNINITQDINNIRIKMDDAISLGMIINEAINNSIKYNNKEALIIKIGFYKNDTNTKLIIEDNGKGFDSKNIKEGLGLNLIKQFSNKLKNSILTINSHDGVNIQIIFELVKDDKELAQ